MTKHCAERGYPHACPAALPSDSPLRWRVPEFFSGGIAFHERTDVVESHRLPCSRWYKFLPLPEMCRFEAWAERRLSAHSRVTSMLQFHQCKSGVHFVVRKNSWI